MKKLKSAFTLIEFSITLIIISLIVGAILAGQEMVKQAAIRGLIKDINTIQTMTNTFRIKYNFLPGDFPNAGAIWTSSTCTNSAAPIGCNGDGDWQIDLTETSGDETYRFWQHLSLAGLTSVQYNGTKLSNSIFQSSYSNKTLIGARYTFYSGIPLGNYFEIGAWRSNAGTANDGSITPQDAYSIDLKIDDGFPYSGRLFGATGVYSTAACCSRSTYYTQLSEGPYCNLHKVILY